MGSLKLSISSKSVGKLYFLICMLIFCFVSKNEAIYNKGIVIPYINYNVIFLVLAVSFIFFVALLLLRTSAKMDIIATLLLLRIFLNLVPLLYIEAPPSYLGRFLTTCIPFFAYTIFLSSNVSLEEIEKASIFFGIVISLQCIWAYYSIVAQGIATYFDLWYKSFFVIPIGGTNHIACVLVPLLIIGRGKLSGWKKLLFSCLVIIAVVLTKSRGGVVLLAVYLLVEVKKYFDIKRKRFLYYLLMALSIISVIVITSSTLELEGIQMFLRGYSTSSGASFDILLTGRFSIFETYFKYISNHLFWGNGISYDQLELYASGAHNIIISILYENGIAGLLLFSIIGSRIVKGIKNYRSKERFALGNSNSVWSKTPAVAIIFIFINSLFEQCLFSTQVDFIFLAMVAIVMNNNRNADNNSRMIKRYV